MLLTCFEMSVKYFSALLNNNSQSIYNSSVEFTVRLLHYLQTVSRNRHLDCSCPENQIRNSFNISEETVGNVGNRLSCCDPTELRTCTEQFNTGGSIMRKFLK